MIVKVQVSLASHIISQMVLVYDQKRKVEYQEEATPEILNKLNNEVKSFWYADRIEEGKVKLISKAPWQDW